MTRNNKYKISLEQISSAQEVPALHAPITIEIENHDDLFEIVEQIKCKQIFEDSNRAAAFAIGIKMFAQELVMNKSHPLFTDFLPEFVTFMRRFKTYQG